MATLTDLPDELLRLIFLRANVRSHELHKLPRQSSRFRRVCLNMYLSLNAGPNLQQKCVAKLSCDGPQQDVVSVLLAIEHSHITRMEDFECQFQRGTVRVAAMQRDMERVSLLLSGLGSVGRVVLDFDRAQRWVDVDISREDVEGLYQAFRQLLDNILERSCTSLEANGARRLSPPCGSNPSHLPNFLAEFKTSIKRVVNRDIGFHLTRRLKHQRRSSPEHFKLSHLTIGSELMLLDHLTFHWTCSTLRTSRITTLTLLGLHLWVTDWSTIAQSLPTSAPNLKTLNISQIHGIGWRDLGVLVDGFSKLEYVSISKPSFAPRSYIGLDAHKHQKTSYTKCRLTSFNMGIHAGNA